MVDSISHVIQLSVAPVFLLTGIAGLLSVLSARLGRIIDRARILDGRLPATGDAESPLRAEADFLWRRIGIMNWSIRLSVSSALMICVVVVCLFVGGLASVNLGRAIAVLFVLAMLLIIVALILLLAEVSISTRRMRSGLAYLMDDSR